MVFKIQLFTQKRCDVKIRNVQKTKVPSSSIIFKKKGDVSIDDISKALRCITSTAGKRELSLQILFRTGVAAHIEFTSPLVLDRAFNKYFCVSPLKMSQNYRRTSSLRISFTGMNINENIQGQNQKAFLSMSTLKWHNLPGRLLEEGRFCQAVNETWQRPDHMRCSTKWNAQNQLRFHNGEYAY